MKYKVQHKLTDRWQCLTEYGDEGFALRRAKELAKDHVKWGMTRVVLRNKVIRTFSRGGHEF